MGYQLDFYGLPWLVLKKEWLQSHPRAFVGRAILDPDHAEKFIAAIRESGVLLSSLDHTSSDAEEFLEHFLGEIVPQAFSATGLREQLMDRGLFGIAGDVMPVWGGLTLEEIGRLLGQYRRPAELTEDEESWLEDMRDALEDAKE